jgi:hypothetical protein
VPIQIQISCPKDNDPVNQDFWVTGTVSSNLASPQTRSKKAARARSGTTTTTTTTTTTPPPTDVYIRCVVWNPSTGENYKGDIQTGGPSWSYHFTVAIPTLALAYLMAQLVDSPTEPAGVITSTSIRISVVATGGVDCSPS